MAQILNKNPCLVLRSHEVENRSVDSETIQYKLDALNCFFFFPPDKHHRKGCIYQKVSIHLSLFGTYMALLLLGIKLFNLPK